MSTEITTYKGGPPEEGHITRIGAHLVNAARMSTLPMEHLWYRRNTEIPDPKIWDISHPSSYQFALEGLEHTNPAAHLSAKELFGCVGIISTQDPIRRSYDGKQRHSLDAPFNNARHLRIINPLLSYEDFNSKSQVESTNHFGGGFTHLDPEWPVFMLQSPTSQLDLALGTVEVMPRANLRHWKDEFMFRYYGEVANPRAHSQLVLTATHVTTPLNSPLGKTLAELNACIGWNVHFRNVADDSSHSSLNAHGAIYFAGQNLRRYANAMNLAAYQNVFDADSFFLATAVGAKMFLENRSIKYKGAGGHRVDTARTLLEGYNMLGHNGPRTDIIMPDGITSLNSILGMPTQIVDRNIS